MLSVTSDVAASATYQSAPPKPALPDPSQLSSSFAAMVDTSLSADPSSALPPAPEPAAPPPSRPANNASGSDNNPPRNTQASDQPPPSRSDDSSSSTPPAAKDTASADAKTDAPAKGSSGKSSTAKNQDGKSADKTSEDSSKSTEATDTTKPTDTQTVTQDPIAALIPVAAAPVGPQPTPANANAPLAIAAAAIAATASTTAALTGLPAQAKAVGEVTAKNGDTATAAKAQFSTPATGAATTQQVATDATATADATIETAALTPGATAPKTGTGFKTTATVQARATATNAAGGTAQTSDHATTASTNATNAAPQPLVQGKPDQAAAQDGAIKADANVPAPSAQSTHDHTAAAAGNQAAAAPIDPNAQLAALPQQLSNTAPASASDKFSVTQATGGPVPVSGLAVEIAATVRSGKTEFEVRLDPADLGRIDVRIAVDRNGQVTSHLTVEKPETLSMLQQGAPQLQQALNDAGLKTDGGGLQFSLRDQSSSGQNNPNNQNGAQPQRLVISEDDAIPAAVAGRSYGRMLGGNGGVDIRV